MLRTTLSCLFFFFGLFSSVMAHNAPYFSYAFPIEIAHGSASGEELPADIELFARRHYKDLVLSPFFDKTLICDAKRTRSFHTTEKHDAREVGREFEVTTSDHVVIEGTFFDRGSDTLLVVGSGFTNDREKMSPFLHLFPDYDVVIFDFRGHGYRPFDIGVPRTWYKNTSQLVFGLDACVSGLGSEEEKDVFAVVDGLKTYKHYKRVFGVALCYGAFIFLKALALRPDLFDKLIVDGCWESVAHIISHLRQDVGLTCNPQRGGLKDVWPWHKTWVQNATLWFAQHVAGFKLTTDLSLLNFLPRITQTPVLFLYGKDDLMVSRKDFEDLWSALPVRTKSAVITSNPHVLNHLKQKEFYRLISELFFELPHDLFVHCTTSVEHVVAYYQEKLAHEAGQSTDCQSRRDRSAYSSNLSSAFA